MKDKLIIFDTTMRDGEQSPGASMTKEEKLRIARLLERMRVDVIEAGFPASSNGDSSGAGGRGRDQGLDGGRPVPRQRPRHPARIDALKKAKSGRIHVFIATSGAPYGKEAAHDA